MVSVQGGMAEEAYGMEGRKQRKGQRRRERDIPFKDMPGGGKEMYTSRTHLQQPISGE